MYAMKKLNSLFAAIFFCNAVNAQELKLASGGELKLFPGTSFAANGLELVPSASFALGDFQLQQNSTTTGAVENAYVSRVYRFDPLTPLFSGSIKFSYLEEELNGIDESQLRLHVHNGTKWQLAGTSTADINLNYVITDNISNLSLAELVLASVLALPLKWHSMSAFRQNASVIIKWSTEQEQNVSHFDVERSIDGIHWSIAIAGIPAGNTSSVQYYEESDMPNFSGNIYYRVRQTDFDKRETISSTIRVVADKASLVVSPNPASSYFTLSGIDFTTINRVELFNNNGLLLKTWNSKEAQYRLPVLAAGSYVVRIQSKDGTVVSKQLLVR